MAPEDVGKRVRLTMLTTQLQLTDATTFEEAMQKILTPMGAGCILRAWTFLQQSSAVFRCRSLAQMFFCAGPRLQMNFAVLCANFFADTDGRRPTRHAKSSEFFNKLAEEQRVISHYIISNTGINKAVQSSDDLSGTDPWVFRGSDSLALRRVVQ